MNAEKYSHIVIHHGMHLIGSMTMDDDPKHTADAVKSYLDRNTQSCIMSSCTTACFQLSLFLSCHFEFCIPPKISYDFILSFRLSLLFIVNSPNLSFPAHLCCCCLISFSVWGFICFWYFLFYFGIFCLLCLVFQFCVPCLIILYYFVCLVSLVFPISLITSCIHLKPQFPIALCQIVVLPTNVFPLLFVTLDSFSDFSLLHFAFGSMPTPIPNKIEFVQWFSSSLYKLRFCLM